MTGREKWKMYLAGDDVGPMVCPLCDKWGVGDMAYKWTGPEPEPFSGDESRWAFRGQIMMAKTFGWDPLFYAAINFAPTDKSLTPTVEKIQKGNKIQTFSTICTPLGDLTRIDENNGITQRCLKEYLANESDYEKMLWLINQEFDREAAIAEGRKLREAAGELGMLGSWVSPSAIMADVQVLFYHLMDYPQAFQRLFDAKKKLLRLHLEVYREAGFDFMFYCVPGTDMISPGFFREWIADETRENIKWWKSLGGFTLWHGCGHVKAYAEQGIFNDMRPEIVETLSQPPVGNIPSLSWARKRIDPEIITKGNIPLDILLNGTPEAVREDVCRIKKETEGYRHIIGLSDNILDGTPKENLRAFVEESIDSG